MAANKASILKIGTVAAVLASLGATESVVQAAESGGFAKVKFSSKHSTIQKLLESEAGTLKNGIRTTHEYRQVDYHEHGYREYNQHCGDC